MLSKLEDMIQTCDAIFNLSVHQSGHKIVERPTEENLQDSSLDLDYNEGHKQNNSAGG